MAACLGEGAGYFEAQRALTNPLGGNPSGAGNFKSASDAGGLL